MKKILLVLCFSFFSSVLVAQEGIQFYHGTWKEALAKAKQENKLVFVDVATSWCGPCKRMAAQVFPLKEVGAVFNKAFVSYKIDAEKGEGIAIAKKFSVRAFPTYLFVSGDGILVYRSGGYRQPKDFINEAKTAIKEKNAPKPFAQWEDEYNAGKRDKDFLIGYLKKRAALKMPSAKVIEEVFPLLTPQNLNNVDFLSSILYYNSNIEYVPKGKFYKYVIKNSKSIDSLIGKPNPFSLQILGVGLMNYFRKNIIKNHREEMLPVMVAANKELLHLLDKNGELTSKEIVMNYYAGTHNASALIPAAQNYVNNGLFKQDIEGLKAADKADFQKYMKPFLSGDSDSTKVQAWKMMRRLKVHKRMIGMSYNLRNAAEAIYKNVNDKKALKQAAEWARIADSWFPHFSSKAVLAGLLFKIGQKQKAIEIMKKASQDNFIEGRDKQSRDKQNLLLANIKEMKSGKAPDILW